MIPEHRQSQHTDLTVHVVQTENGAAKNERLLRLLHEHAERQRAGCRRGSTDRRDRHHSVAALRADVVVQRAATEQQSQKKAEE